MSDSEVYRLISRLEQRVSNLIRVGRIAAVQDSPPRVKVEYDKDNNGDPVTTTWLCYFEERQGYLQTWNPPKVGEQCVIVSPSGDLRLGKVLLGLNTTENAPISTNASIHKLKFSDGSTFEFDRASHQWTIFLGSGSSVFNGSLFTFNSDIKINGNVTHTGNMNQTGNQKVTGNITATANITGNMIYDAVGPISAIRTIYNGHRHLSSDPVPDKQM